MKVHQDRVVVSTRGRGLVDVTAEVQGVVESSGVRTGLCTVFVQHTSASLVIQENADASVRRDLERWIERICPEDASAYEHDDEGTDDMPAHLRSAITKTSETIPITNGRLALGTWQAIYLWEHRRTPHTRNLVVHVQGVSTM
jgi:secondary thiamine-phosphate synthase enzyme